MAMGDPGPDKASDTHGEKVSADDPASVGDTTADGTSRQVPSGRTREAGVDAAAAPEATRTRVAMRKARRPTPDAIHSQSVRAKRPMRRTLTARMELLREEERELRLYERLVSRSLEDMGMDQDQFDKHVEQQMEGHVSELHQHYRSQPQSLEARRLSVSKSGQAERFQLANVFAKLAVWRIDPGSIEWNAPYSRMCFLWAHDPRWGRAVRACVCVYAFITFFEAERTSVPAASGLPGAREWLWWVALLEGVAATGYFADVCFGLGYQRRDKVFEQRQNYVRALIATACLADYLVALGVTWASAGTVTYLRWSRPLRMLYLPFTNKACFNSVLSIMDTLPSLGDLLLLGLIFTFLWSILAVSIFSWPSLRDEHYAGDDSNAFDSFDLSFVALLTLMTGENYPNVMWPAMNMHPAAVLFFFAFVLVGTIMIMPTIVAIVFDFYKRFHGLKVLEEKMVERRCLLMSFALVDEDNSGTISFSEFAKLCTAVNPKSSATQRSLLYKLLDSDGNNHIAASEFIRLCDVLLLDVREDTHEITKRWPLLKRRVQRVRAITETDAFESFVLLVIILYVVVLALQAHPVHQHLMAEVAYDAIDVAFLAIFAVEMALKIMAQSVVGYFADMWNRLDCFIVCSSVVMVVVQHTIAELFAAGAVDTAPARVLRMLRVLRTVRTAAIFSHSHKLRMLTRTFIQMRPVILTILGTIFLVFYLYLIVGMEAFHGRSSWPETTAEKCLDWCPGFDNVLLSVVTLLQLVLAANWNELTYALDGEGGRFLTWVYLITFVLLTNAIMLSLLAALVLEIYSVETEKLVRRSQTNQLATLFPKEALDRGTGGGVSAEKYVVVLSNGVRKMFERYDQDSSGAISALELGSLLRDLGERLSTAELKEVLETLDVDANGQVSFVEFMAWWQRYGLEKVFRRFDADQSGTIDASELGKLMAEVGSPLEGEELEAALVDLDQDGSGSIGFDEYTSWFEDYDVRKVFNSFDTDGSGFISKLELEQILGHMGIELSHSELKTALQRLDKDVDGGVSFAEFLPWWKELSYHKEEKAFMVEHDRSRKWEENLFLRRRSSNALATLLATNEEGSPGRDVAARGLLLRQIAADHAAGKQLTEEYLMSHYGFDVDQGSPSKPARDVPVGAGDGVATMGIRGGSGSGHSEPPLPACRDIPKPSHEHVAAVPPAADTRTPEGEHLPDGYVPWERPMCPPLLQELACAKGQDGTSMAAADPKFQVYGFPTVLKFAQRQSPRKKTSAMGGVGGAAPKKSQVAPHR